VGKPEGKSHLIDVGLSDMIILHGYSRNRMGMGWGAWTGLIWLMIGTVEGYCKRGNEPSVFIKCWEFLD